MVRVALCGVFDIPNYGDHLFPQILRVNLEERGFQGEIELFSPFQAKESFVEDSFVHSLDSLESKHLEQPFDAIIVGGGEIIHWHKFPQMLDFEGVEAVPYPMHKIWMIPSLMKKKYGVRVLWNAPGIPHALQNEKEEALELFSEVDYLSVRNAFSVEVLKECGIPEEKISLIPDTAFDLGRYAQSLDLDQLLLAAEPKLMGVKYAIFHTNASLPESEREYVVDTLTYLHAVGFEIILLPLAYTHGDLHGLSILAEELPFEVIFNKCPYSLNEIIAIFAHAELYLGTSLHGAVTASVFGKKVISFDYHQTKKTRDLFLALGMNKFYVTKGQELLNITQKAIEKQQTPQIEAMKSVISQHFDVLFEFLKPAGPQSSLAHEVATLSSVADSIQVQWEYRAHINGLIHQVQDMSRSIDELLSSKEAMAQRIEELHVALETNENLVQFFKATSESWEKDWQELRRHHDSLIELSKRRPLRALRRLRRS